MINIAGIVIRESDLGENDKIVKILTENGIISAIVRRCKSVKSRKNAAMQLLSYCRFSVYEGKKGYIIEESEIINMFWNIRNNLETLSLAQYFCELSLSLRPDKESASDFLKLFLNSLFFLSENTYNIRLIKAIFEMRACSLCGYMPNLLCCDGCGSYEAAEMGLLMQSAKLMCRNCRKQQDFCLYEALTPGALAALRHIIYSEMRKLFSFKISDKTLEDICKISEKYVLYHVGAYFKALEFYKNISGY